MPSCRCACPAGATHRAHHIALHHQFRVCLLGTHISLNECMMPTPTITSPLTQLLSLLRVQAVPLHASMQQRQRLKNLDRLRTSKDCVIVSTDVAARGLDVPKVRASVRACVRQCLRVRACVSACVCVSMHCVIRLISVWWVCWWWCGSNTNELDGVVVVADIHTYIHGAPQVEHVIHFHVPRSAEVFVHRSGRTARAEAKGGWVCRFTGCGGGDQSFICVIVAC